jgi:hypothetical protein
MRDSSSEESVSEEEKKDNQSLADLELSSDDDNPQNSFLSKKISSLFNLTKSSDLGKKLIP